MGLTLLADAAKNQRQFARRKISDWHLLTVDILRSTLEQPTPQQRAIMLNISAGGMGVQPVLSLAPTTILAIRFAFPGVATPVACRVIVVWAAVGGPVGIQFIDLDLPFRDQLQKWVGSDLSLPSQQTLEATSDPTRPTPGANEFANALALIASRAMVVTRASGVAIALGDSHGMHCRVSVGLAPDPGVALLPGRGLSGECLSTGEVVYCCNAQSDSRVEPVAARLLETRSILVLPVFASGKLAGVLEVLSPQHSAFDNYEIKRLTGFAALLGTAIDAAQVLK